MVESTVPREISIEFSTVEENCSRLPVLHRTPHTLFVVALYLASVHLRDVLRIVKAALGLDLWLEDTAGDGGSAGSGVGPAQGLGEGEGRGGRDEPPPERGPRPGQREAGGC